MWVIDHPPIFIYGSDLTLEISDLYIQLPPGLSQKYFKLNMPHIGLIIS